MSTATTENEPQVDATQPDVVVLIHGTFAYDDADDAVGNRRRWWQRKSLFCDQLVEHLPDLPVEFEIFHWSGANRESNRRSAAQLLLDRLSDLNSKGRRFHVIAHSHGGSVLWEALCLAVRRPYGVLAAPANALSGLKTWTTVGTPFLLFVPAIAGLFAGVTLAALILLTYFLNHQWRWFVDYWTQFKSEISEDWLPKVLAAQTAYLSLVLIAAFVHLSFRAFAVWRAQSDPRWTSEAPRNEWLRLWKVIYGVATLLVIFLAAAWWFDLFGKMRPVGLAGLHPSSDDLRQFLPVASNCRWRRQRVDHSADDLAGFRLCDARQASATGLANFWRPIPLGLELLAR